MLSHYLILAALWGLVATGLFGVLKVSYLEIIGAASCPHIAAIPICYLVTIGYSLMFLALLSAIWGSVIPKALFISGWAITFLIAMAGTMFEVMHGHTCPRGFGDIPLCFISLIFSVAILLLFGAVSSQGSRAQAKH